MIEFFRSLFGIRSDSGNTAKERLRLVLLSDHLSLAPELVDSLKAELLEVIARYVDIDSGAADITFEHRDREIAMLASVPVTGVRKDAPVRNGTTAVVAPTVETASVVEIADQPLQEPQAQRQPAEDEPAADALAPARVPQQSNQPSRPRRRRRRRAPAPSAVAEQTPLEERPANTG